MFWYHNGKLEFYCIAVITLPLVPGVLHFYVSTIIRHVLHKYANEDVSLGSWFIGLDVEHVDDRRLCCGTPPGKLIPSRSFSIDAYS